MEPPSIVKKTTLGERVRQARREAGLSAEELAYGLGMSVSSVYRWEQERGTPPAARKIRRVAELTGKPLKFFIEDADNEAAA